MKIPYETGTATLIQFLTMGILNLATGLNSVISSCRSGEGCMTQVLVSPIYYMLLTGWFAALWVLGYLAQERRSKWLARILICAEGLVVIVALVNARNHNEFIGLLTSSIDVVLALWVMLVAFRLMLAGPKRVVKGAGRGRPRQRKSPG